jgi:hypothetical protein
LIANEAGIPSVLTDTPASTGPIARARLNVIEFSATAEPRCSFGTRPPTRAMETGALNALITPSPSANTITTQTRASPPHASPARIPDSAAATSCVVTSRRRRSKRSAALPAHGASTSTGTKLPKLSTPSRNGECVSRKTRIDAARFWNHVPLADAALPTKYGPKFRSRISRRAAAGPAAATR